MTRRKDQRSNYQFFYRVSIGPRSVENDNATVGAFINRNIIYSGTALAIAFTLAGSSISCMDWLLTIIASGFLNSLAISY
jgi:hypothetical protein